MIALSELRVGETGIVGTVNLPEEMIHYLAHLGFLPGVSVDVLRRAPAGDPTVYSLHGVEVGLRFDTARHILMEMPAQKAVTA